MSSPITDEPPKRCIGCGYILEGLPKNRCPECGREFNPDDPSSFVTKLVDGRRQLVWSIGAVVAIGLGPLVVYLTDRFSFMESTRNLPLIGVLVFVVPLFLFSVMIGGWVAAYSVLEVSYKVLVQERRPARHHGALRAAMLISALTLVVTIGRLLRLDDLIMRWLM